MLAIKITSSHIINNKSIPIIEVNTQISITKIFFMIQKEPHLKNVIKIY